MTYLQERPTSVAGEAGRKNRILCAPQDTENIFSSIRTPCPSCGARRGYAPLVGSDGGYCHACSHYDPPTGTATHTPRPSTLIPAPGPSVIAVTRWQHVATYTYTDEQGVPLYCVDRYARMETLADGATRAAKTFRQRPAHVPPSQQQDGTPIGAALGDIRRVLYRLPDVLGAIRAGARVIVVEGERDADTLTDLLVEHLGSPDRATTGAGGAGGWRPEYADSLRGAHILLWPDRDAAGARYADAVAASLRGVALSVDIYEGGGTHGTR